MIITTLKPEEEVLSQLKARGVKRLFLLGCGDCATICGTGSEEVLLERKKHLESLGFTISGTAVVEVGCNAAQVSICFAKQKQALKEAEALLVFSCGLGIQSAALHLREHKEIIAACNTHSVGVVNKQHQAEQLCSLCGECNLTETGSLCVKTLCPKEMANGPCGGVSDGKCEVFRDRECVWVSIFKKAGGTKSRLFTTILPPRKFSKGRHPQKFTLPK